MVRITTEWGPHLMSLNESELLLFPWFAPGVHPNRLNPWKVSDNLSRVDSQLNSTRVGTLIE